MAKMPGYKIDQLPAVKDQLRALAARAVAVGIGEDYVRALHYAIAQLQTRPLEWGDPEWSTYRPGGVVCHGICEPLFVQYVVFEPERVVCILMIKALSPSPLA